MKCSSCKTSSIVTLGIGIFVIGAILGAVGMFLVPSPSKIKSATTPTATGSIQPVAVTNLNYEEIIGKSSEYGGGLVSALHELNATEVEYDDHYGLIQTKTPINNSRGIPSIVPFGYWNEMRGFFVIGQNDPNIYQTFYYVPKSAFMITDTVDSHRYIEAIHWKDNANTIVYTLVTGAPGGFVKEQKEFTFPQPQTAPQLPE